MMWILPTSVFFVAPVSQCGLSQITVWLNLKTAVGREKAVQAIDVHREFKNCVVTFWVMSQFFNFLGASRDCADFRDPTHRF